MKRHADRFTDVLKIVTRLAVRVLAVLMTVVIVLGVVDVGRQLHHKAMEPPVFILTISDMLGAFMAVLIAIEIFVNITIYLRDDVIHVKIVMATALMAIGRKSIMLDVDRGRTAVSVGPGVHRPCHEYRLLARRCRSRLEERRTETREFQGGFLRGED